MICDVSRIVETATLLLLSACLAACSGQSEATTREAQERKFRELLGFSPPEAIIEIQAADASHRGVVDAAYVRWLRFTYDPIVWDRAVRGRRSRVSADDRADPIRQDAIGQEIAPAWFREGHVEAVVELRVLGHEDTPEDEGFAFEEILWHDGRSIYLCKRYWD